jgi:Flp pilus assembly protein TadD
LHFREAVRLKPDCAKAHHNWGLALASQGRMQEAIAHYREASRIKAGHARGSLDIALTGQ